MSGIYAFNIVLEAKVRTLVIMVKKYHSDWSNKQIVEFLQGAIEYAVKKELEEKGKDEET
jgi:HJR/Mrr/RecB family endonuclease